MLIFLLINPPFLLVIDQNNSFIALVGFFGQKP